MPRTDRSPELSSVDYDALRSLTTGWRHHPENVYAKMARYGYAERRILKRRAEYRITQKGIDARRANRKGTDNGR